MTITDEFDWLQDLTRRQEVVDWFADHGVNMDQVIQWARTHQKVDLGDGNPTLEMKTLKLDKLKDWVDGKYDLFEVLNWQYHNEQGELVVRVQAMIDAYREIPEKHGGFLDLVGISSEGAVHVAYEGKCGSCSLLESNTLKSLEAELLKIPGVTSVVNDGPVAVQRTDNSQGTYVEIQPRVIN